QDGEYSLEEAGLEASLKALHGKPKRVRRYALADDYLFIAVFQSNTVVKFRDEEQLIRIWRDLGIIFSLPRFKATVEKLMGTSRRGQLQVLLANDQTATLTINRDTPNWEGSLFAICEEMGGGAKGLRAI